MFLLLIYSYINRTFIVLRVYTVYIAFINIKTIEAIFHNEPLQKKSIYIQYIHTHLSATAQKLRRPCGRDACFVAILAGRQQSDRVCLGLDSILGGERRSVTRHRGEPPLLRLILVLLIEDRRKRRKRKMSSLAAAARIFHYLFVPRENYR